MSNRSGSTWPPSFMRPRMPSDSESVLPCLYGRSFAVSASKDRPYKQGKTLSESLGILGRMKEGGHVDPDLFDIFVRDKVYLRYAREFLDPEQIDDVDDSRIPGYRP